MILKVIDINVEKSVCTSNKEYISGHGCQRTNMAAK